MIEAIDVSSDQDPGKIDRVCVAAAGITRVYARASDGVDWEDKYFCEHMVWARKNGETGAYHFLRVRHNRPQDAELQARQFVAKYRREGCTATAALDCELVPSGLPNAALHNTSTDAEWAIAGALWRNVVLSELGAVMPYGSPSFFEERPMLAAVFAADPLWVSHYGVAVPRVPPPWTDWAGWQYAASEGLPKGQVDGIEGYVDRSHFRT